MRPAIFYRYFVAVLTCCGGPYLTGQLSTSISITEDAAVYYRYSTSAMYNNYGTNVNLHVLTGTAGSNATNWRSYLKVDLSSLSQNSVVTKALLNLEALSTRQNSGSNAVILHQTSPSWDESTITWDNQPAGYEIGVYDPVIAAGGTGPKEADITHWVHRALAAGEDELSIMIKLVTEIPGQVRKMSFASSDHATASYRPTVEVTYYPNKIYTTTSLEESNNIYQFAWGNLNLKVDRQFVSHSSDLSYEILDMENTVQTAKTSSNISVDHCYVEIDDSSLSLSPGQVYSLVLYNENNEKRFLKFKK